MIELLSTPVDFILRALVALAVWKIGSTWALNLFMGLVTKIPKFPMSFYGPIRIAFMVLVGYIALGIVGIDLGAIFAFITGVLASMSFIIAAGIMLAFALSKRGQDLVGTRAVQLVSFVEGLLKK